MGSLDQPSNLFDSVRTSREGRKVLEARNIRQFQNGINAVAKANVGVFKRYIGLERGITGDLVATLFRMFIHGVSISSQEAGITNTQMRMLVQIPEAEGFDFQNPTINAACEIAVSSGLAVKRGAHYHFRPVIHELGLQSAAQSF